MELLFLILIMVAVARFGGGLLERMRLPGLLGELLAGVLLGVVLLVSPWEGVQVLNINESPFFKGLLEVSLRSLLRASSTGVPVAVTGAILPFGLGLLVGWAFIPESEVKLVQTFFLGVALSITAVPVSIRVLMDLGLLRSRVGIIIVNAAVIDAIVGVVLLGIMAAMLSSGAGPSAGHILMMLGKLALFLALSVPIALLVVPFIDSRLPRARSGELHFSIILGFGLALAVLSEVLGLHFIIGAFLGGLLLADGIRKSVEDVRDITPFYNVLQPWQIRRRELVFKRY